MGSHPFSRRGFLTSLPFVLKYVQASFVEKDILGQHACNGDKKSFINISINIDPKEIAIDTPSSMQGHLLARAKII